MRKLLLAAVSALALAPFAAQAQMAATYGDNILINPWMEIDQVSEGATKAATVAASGTYTIVKSGDGWYAINSNNSTGSPTTAFQNAVVYANGAAFDLKYTSGTAGTAGASDLLTIFQPIEPTRAAQLQYGTSNGQGSYVSFCAQASTAGTYSFYIMPNLLSGISATSNSQTSFYQQFTLGAATKQCFQFYVPPAPTAGVFGLTTNTVDSTHGLNLGFTLGVGTNLGGATLCTPNNGVWMTSASSKQCLGVSTQVALNNLTGATFEVTGVKWSLSPTPLAHFPAAELMEAQRYFTKTYAAGSGGVAGVAPAQNVGSYVGTLCAMAGATGAGASQGATFQFPVNMRSAPSITTFNPKAAAATWSNFSQSDAAMAVTVDPATQSSTRGVFIKNTGTATAVSDVACIGAQADARL